MCRVARPRMISHFSIFRLLSAVARNAKFIFSSFSTFLSISHHLFLCVLKLKFVTRVRPFNSSAFHFVKTEFVVVIAFDMRPIEINKYWLNCHLTMFWNSERLHRLKWLHQLFNYREIEGALVATSLRLWRNTASSNTMHLIKIKVHVKCILPTTQASQ